MMTTSFPFFATHKIKMSTMPSESPTIMKGPDNWFIKFSKKIEKCWYMQVIAMNIMQMDNIWIILLNILNKSFCCFL